jgi:hypothetical protein
MLAIIVTSKVEITSVFTYSIVTTSLISSFVGIIPPVSGDVCPQAYGIPKLARANA